MGWETRHGKHYYYRKRRVGARVVSEYVGRDQWAETLATCDHLDRAQVTLARTMERMARADVEALDRTLADVEAVVRTVTRAVLVANGYRTHKGQWRKHRDTQPT